MMLRSLLTLLAVMAAFAFVALSPEWLKPYSTWGMALLPAVGLLLVVGVLAFRKKR